jgi:hypothetical protein
MRIVGLKRFVWFVLVALFCGSATPLIAFADDGGRGEPAKPATTAKIKAPASGSAQTAGVSDPTLEPATPTAAISSFAVEHESDVEQAPAGNESPTTNQQPQRRALPAPLDGIFPGSDYLGPTPLIGVPDTDPVYPLTKALWDIAPALKRSRIKAYGWINPGISVH